MSWEDPIVAEVRRVREEMAAEFDFDIAAIFSDIRLRQSAAGERLVRLVGDRGREQTSESEQPVDPVSTR